MNDHKSAFPTNFCWTDKKIGSHAVVAEAEVETWD